MHLITLKIPGWNEVMGDTLAAGAQLNMTDVEFRRYDSHSLAILPIYTESMT